MKFLLILALSPFLFSCSDECELLAEETCARVGESSAECAKIRERASNASHDDKRVCGQARSLTQRLTPKN
jgi:hypothetical protein